MIKEKYRDMCREMVEFTCELCKRNEKDCGKLEAHRKIRGNKGGKYIPSNILMLCKSCHSEIHGSEFR